MNRLKIWQPRYHDSVVLLARFNLPCGQDVEVEIESGAYKGLYIATNKVICDSPTEPFTTRNGRTISMRAVPLDKLERIEE